MTDANWDAPSLIRNCSVPKKEHTINLIVFDRNNKPHPPVPIIIKRLSVAKLCSILEQLSNTVHLSEEQLTDAINGETDEVRLVYYTEHGQLER
jgi:hypothetical protein